MWRLATDPRFAAELRYCHEHAIPHSEFLGWHPDDQAKALAYAAFESQRCGQCGVHPLLWPEDSRDPPYEVDAHRCQGCVAVDRWTKGIPEHASRAGIRVGWAKVPGTPTVPGLVTEEVIAER